VEGKLKLSQNRSPDDRRRVREQLQGSTDPMARDAAGWNAWRIRPWTAPSESLNLPG
jgi:predicted FMN-binding regulatory protein PaiB